MKGKIVEPEDINRYIKNFYLLRKSLLINFRCLQALRPYHSLLLLHPMQQMHDFTSLDGSPTLVRLLTQYSPLKNLQTLAADADLTLSHVKNFFLNFCKF